MKIRMLSLLPLTLALLMTACGQKVDGPVEAASSRAEPRGSRQSSDAPMAASMMAARSAPSVADRQLSYKHRLEIEVPAGQVEVALKALQVGCQAVPEQGCVVMQASRNQGLRAGIFMSVRRQAVDSLRAQATSFGKLLSQDTVAEDVTGPITDVTRRLAMQEAFREDLLELRKQSRGNIEALIKATEKLAEVQAQIEAGEGDLAALHSRVAMDELRVDLSLARAAYPDDRHPVSDALAGFVGNLARGLGALIEFLALVAPWLLLLAVLPFVWRGLRRIWKLGRRA